MARGNCAAEHIACVGQNFDASGCMLALHVLVRSENKTRREPGHDSHTHSSVRVNPNLHGPRSSNAGSFLGPAARVLGEDDPRCSLAWAPLPSPSPPPSLIGCERCAVVGGDVCVSGFGCGLARECVRLPPVERGAAPWGGWVGFAGGGLRVGRGERSAPGLRPLSRPLIRWA